MWGQVGALIALGVGVKDILTGRENIYAMAALRGLSKSEADRKIDEIIEFSDLEDLLMRQCKIIARVCVYA